MAGNVPKDVLDQLKATNGKVITCKAAVAWEPKKPLDVTDIQVRITIKSELTGGESPKVDSP